MYKVANDKINEGLSPLVRYLLAFFSGLFGLGMILIAPPTEKAIFYYLFGGFCLLICFVSITKGKVRQFIGSIIGVLLFFLSGWYLVSQLLSGPFISGSRSEPSFINSIYFFIAFGIPGVSYAIKVKFGKSKNN